MRLAEGGMDDEKARFSVSGSSKGELTVLLGFDNDRRLFAVTAAEHTVKATTKS